MWKNLLYSQMYEYLVDEVCWRATDIVQHTTLIFKTNNYVNGNFATSKPVRNSLLASNLPCRTALLPCTTTLSEPPANLTAINITHTGLTLQWQAVARFSCTSNYTVSYVNSTGSVNQLTTSHIQISIGGLQPETLYDFTVASTTSAGIGTASNLTIATNRKSINWRVCYVLQGRRLVIGTVTVKIITRALLQIAFASGTPCNA